MHAILSILSEVLLVGLLMSLVGILNPVILHIEEEAMSLLVLIFLLLYLCFSLLLLQFQPIFVVCRHFYCPMSLFQDHVACRNFTLTGPP